MKKIKPKTRYYRIANRIMKEYEPQNLGSLLTHVLAVDQKNFSIEGVMARWNKVENSPWFGWNPSMGPIITVSKGWNNKKAKTIIMDELDEVTVFGKSICKLIPPNKH